jgi:hypothetical protein
VTNTYLLCIIIYKHCISSYLHNVHYKILKVIKISDYVYCTQMSVTIENLMNTFTTMDSTTVNNASMGSMPMDDTTDDQSVSTSRMLLNKNDDSLKKLFPSYYLHLLSSLDDNLSFKVWSNKKKVTLEEEVTGKFKIECTTDPNNKTDNYKFSMKHLGNSIYVYRHYVVEAGSESIADSKRKMRKEIVVQNNNVYVYFYDGDETLTYYFTYDLRDPENKHYDASNLNVLADFSHCDDTSGIVREDPTTHNLYYIDDSQKRVEWNPRIQTSDNQLTLYSVYDLNTGLIERQFLDRNFYHCDNERHPVEFIYDHKFTRTLSQPDINAVVETGCYMGKYQLDHSFYGLNLVPRPSECMRIIVTEDYSTVYRIEYSDNGSIECVKRCTNTEPMQVHVEVGFNDDGTVRQPRSRTK